MQRRRWLWNMSRLQTDRLLKLKASRVLKWLHLLLLRTALQRLRLLSHGTLQQRRLLLQSLSFAHRRFLLQRGGLQWWSLLP